MSLKISSKREKGAKQARRKPISKLVHLFLYRCKNQDTFRPDYASKSPKNGLYPLLSIRNSPRFFSRKRLSKKRIIWYTKRTEPNKKGALRGEKQGLSRSFCENRASPFSERVAVAEESIRKRILKVEETPVELRLQGYVAEESIRKRILKDFIPPSLQVSLIDVAEESIRKRILKASILLRVVVMKMVAEESIRKRILKVCKEERATHLMKKLQRSRSGRGY